MLRIQYVESDRSGCGFAERLRSAGGNGASDLQFNKDRNAISAPSVSDCSVRMARESYAVPLKHFDSALRRPFPFVAAGVASFLSVACDIRGNAQPLHKVNP